MAIADKVERYEVFIDQNDYVDYYRSIRLSLESGGEAFIGFPAVRPPNWLQINGNNIVLYMTVDQFTDVYHLLQSEVEVYRAGGHGGRGVLWSLHRRMNDAFERLRDRYLGLLELVLEHRAAVLVGFLALSLGSLLLKHNSLLPKRSSLLLERRVLALARR